MAAPTPEEIQNMPLEQLEQLIIQEAGRVQQLMGAEGGAGAEMPPEPAPPMDMPAPGMEAVAPYMDTGVPLDMLSADIIQQATTALVEGGYLDLASSEMTPELIQVLQAVAERVAPGIYDMSNDADLMEFVNGIANGTIPVPSARESVAATATGADQPAEPADAGNPGASPELGGGAGIY
jgi:hypothetical protein|tara:strand:- start:11500 stop:12039 length:540 start_codon:yes stop_codon:yes gene_type:complete